jgi:fructosamine-3-kinase
LNLELTTANNWDCPIKTEKIEESHSKIITRLYFETGKTFILKQSKEVRSNKILAEAKGLEELSIVGGLLTPKIHFISDQKLILEDFGKSKIRNLYFWEDFGKGLAEQHSWQGEDFGFSSNNFIGDTPQLNPYRSDGFDFYTEFRYLYQARRAFDKGFLDKQWVDAVERFCQRLPEIIPPQKPSLLHGDLWSGNLLSNSEGMPCVIDPAVYYGWRESDLAMTKMFGGFSPAFLDSYEEYFPLEPGFEDRVHYYNLYHWLNHLNLFGDSYLGQVQAILRAF